MMIVYLLKNSISKLNQFFKIKKNKTNNVNK